MNQFQTGHSSEFTCVQAGELQSVVKCRGRYEEVVGPNDFTTTLQVCPDLRVDPGDVEIKRQHGNVSENGLYEGPPTLAAH